MSKKKSMFFRQVSGASLSSANVRLIVGNPASLTANDTYIKNLLEANVGTVQVVNDSSTDYDLITNHDFTVITRSISSSAVASLKTEAKPILTIQDANNDEFSMADGSAALSYGSVTIVNTHPITTGVSSPFEYNLAAATVAQRTMTSATGATATARIVEATTDRNAIFAYDTGDTLVDASTATDKRVFMGGDNASQWSIDTQTIFVNVLKWFYGITI
jgi:hypothetical protein